MTAAELAGDLPQELQRWGGWQRKGDRLVVEGDFRGALFCYHQAEELFPSQRPDFAPGSDWSERSWSGRPVATYLAKASLYSQMREMDAAVYYLQLARKHKEHPADDPAIARAEAFLAFSDENYAAAAEALKESDDLFDMLFAAVCAQQAGQARATHQVRLLWREAHGLPERVRKVRQAGIPGAAWRAAAQVVEG